MTSAVASTTLRRNAATSCRPGLSSLSFSASASVPPQCPSPNPCSFRAFYCWCAAGRSVPRDPCGSSCPGPPPRLGSVPAPLRGCAAALRARARPHEHAARPYRGARVPTCRGRVCMLALSASPSADAAAVRPTHTKADAGRGGGAAPRRSRRARVRVRRAKIFESALETHMLCQHQPGRSFL